MGKYQVISMSNTLTADKLNNFFIQHFELVPSNIDPCITFITRYEQLDRSNMTYLINKIITDKNINNPDKIFLMKDSYFLREDLEKNGLQIEKDDLHERWL